MSKKKRTLRRAVSLVLCLTLLLPLAGCGGRELYERLLIHGIGVDRDGDRFTVTVRSSSAPGEEGEECFHCQGATVAEALGTLPLTTGRQPFYAHNYLVIFGRSCARQGLDAPLDFFLRFHNTRPTVQLYLAEKTAEEILTFQKEGKYLDLDHLQQLREAEADTGQAVTVELLEFVNASRRQGSSPVLPVLALKEDQPALTATAFFRGNQLAGTLNARETRGFLAAKGRLKGGAVRVDREDLGEIVLAISGSDSKVEGDSGLGEQPPRFTVKVKLEADAIALDGGRARLEQEDYPLLEAALARQTEEEIRAAEARTVRERRCDIFGLGALLYRREPDYWLENGENWGEILPRCEINVEVTVHVSRLEQ